MTAFPTDATATPPRRSAAAGVPVSITTAGEWQAMPPLPHLLKRPLDALGWLARALVGTLFGLALLSGMAAVPVLNVLALGYLLEIVGRVARTGQFRSAFYLVPLAARLAGFVIPTVILLLPVRFLVGLAREASVVAPGSAIAWGWLAVAAVAGVIVALHVLLVAGRGGQWWWFFRPLDNARWMRARRVAGGDRAVAADAALGEVIAALRPWHHFRLGLIGFAGVYAWVILPSLVYGQAPDVSGRWKGVCLVIGGAALVVVLGWLPFLQAHFAETGRWRAFLDLGEVRRRFRRSPFCWTLSAVLLFGLSTLVLLYEALLKNKLPPHAVRWDVMAVFLLTILPAKVLVGWAWHRSGNRPESWRSWQWFNRLLIAAALGGYGYFLFLARTGGQLGQNALWQHHALLLPFPF